MKLESNKWTYILGILGSLFFIIIEILILFYGNRSLDSATIVLLGMTTFFLYIPGEIFLTIGMIGLSKRLQTAQTLLVVLFIILAIWSIIDMVFLYISSSLNIFTGFVYGLILSIPTLILFVLYWKSEVLSRVALIIKLINMTIGVVIPILGAILYILRLIVYIFWFSKTIQVIKKDSFGKMSDKEGISVPTMKTDDVVIRKETDKPTFKEFCPYCGVKITHIDSTFCPKCGNKIS